MINFTSPQFLTDLVNILNAFHPNDILFESIVQEFKSKFLLCDLTNHEKTVKTPFLETLRNHLLFNPEDKLFPNDVKYEKIILIIDDSIKLNDSEFGAKLDKIFLSIDKDPIMDIIYCPFFSNSLIMDILAKLSNYSLKIDNFILEFSDDTVYTGTNLFGILTQNFYTFNNTISFQTTNTNNRSTAGRKIPWLLPRCNQITFPSVRILQLDYLAIDRFIYAIIEQYSLVNLLYNHPFPQPSTNRRSSDVGVSNVTSGIEYIFKLFLENVSFYLPKLTHLLFINGKSEECCNFIDLSSLILSKFKLNMCPLRFLFDIHSFKNWDMPNIQYFGGHRFKYDETTLSGSQDDSDKKIKENIILLHEFAKNETSDACTYFRVELFPKGTQKSKLLNWLPSENSRSQHFYNNPFQSDYKSDYRLADTAMTTTVLSKPILCLKCPTLKELELRLLPHNFNDCVKIQGLFLENLECLILQNFKCSDKVAKLQNNNTNSVVMVFNETTFDHEKQSKANYVDEDCDINNVKALGFSSWNYLPLCRQIRLMNNTAMDTQVGTDGCYNIMFKISNLKKHVPLVNLKESFSTYVSDEQKFIVI